ncbi:hypothetical protein CPB85DRAFT_1247430 [Mucidula mucida]|nr:hypothetical protein CPB85DRAFT_1247430 [Mucidula mucida]
MNVGRESSRESSRDPDDPGGHPMLKRTGLIVGPLLKVVASPYPFSPQWYRLFSTAASVRRADHAYPRAETLASKNDGVALQTKQATASTDVALAYASLVLFILRGSDLEQLRARAQETPDLMRCLSEPTQARLLAEEVSLRCPHQTPLLLRLALLLDCPIKKNVYECTTHHLSMQKDWETVLSVFSIAKGQRQLTIRTLNWYTNALIHLRKYTLIHGVLAEYFSANIAPNRRTYQLLIAAYIRNRDLHRAHHTLQAMEASGIPADASSHAAISIPYHNFGSNPQIQNHTLSILDQLPPRVATSILNSLLKLRLEGNDIVGAKQLLSRYRKHQILPIIYAISGYLPANDMHSVDTGVDADAGTYARIINLLADQRRLSDAVELTMAMQSVAISSSPDVVAALIHAYFSTGNPDGAIGLTYIMCGGNHRELFQELSPNALNAQLPFEPKGMHPTIQVFNTLFRGILSTHGLDGVVPVLRIMDLEAIKPNMQTLTILVQHLVNIERTPPQALFRMIRRFSSGIKVGLPTLHPIFSAMIRHERFHLYGQGWDKTAVKFSQTRTEGSPPPIDDGRMTETATVDDFDPTAGILPSRKPPYHRGLRPILDDLSSLNVRSDAAMFALRLQRDASKQDFQGSQNIFDTLLRRGFQPNAYHYSAMMEGFTRAGDLESAKALLQNAHSAGVMPNVVMYTILIVGYARQADTERAIDVFKEMIEGGLTPDIGVIDAVVSSYFAAGLYRVARELLKRCLTSKPHRRVQVAQGVTKAVIQSLS